MNFAVYVGIGILLVLTIIGLLILLRRDSFKSENSKRIYYCDRGAASGSYNIVFDRIIGENRSD